MKIELVKSTQLSGTHATIYNVLLVDEGETLLDRFLQENTQAHQQELLSILSRLRTIGQKTGGRIDFFKHKEGKLGDGVCALYDIPDAQLRLYCIRYGTQIVILGGGGLKPPTTRAWQDDPKLSTEASLIIKIAAVINKAIKAKDLEYTADFMELVGDLIMEID